MTASRSVRGNDPAPRPQRTPILATRRVERRTPVEWIGDHLDRPSSLQESLLPGPWARATALPDHLIRWMTGGPMHPDLAIVIKVALVAAILLAALRAATVVL